MLSTVSIVVPCYNEEDSIGSLLGAILTQTYPLKNLEVLIADGLSQDKTREVVTRFGAAHPELALRLVDNTRRTIPSGLNQGIREAQGEIIIRLDAHSIPIPEYVERCVQAIENGRGTSVGGVWNIEPGGPGWMANGIAAAAGHVFGAGDALYRLGGSARAVDTVPFGAFRRDLVQKLGGFDESLLTNEDYEFNVRIRQSGGVVWFDPLIRSTYLARKTLRQLAAQYWRYGFWKLRMLLRYPGTLRWRQALPPTFLLGLTGMALCSLFWPPGRLGLLAVLGLYMLTLLVAGIDLGLRGRALGLVPSSMLALATMHIAWGSGFWWSLINRWRRPHG